MKLPVVSCDAFELHVALSSTELQIPMVSDAPHLHLDEDVTPGTAARPCGRGQKMVEESLALGTSTTSYHFRVCKAYARHMQGICKAYARHTQGILGTIITSHEKVRVWGNFGLCCFTFVIRMNPKGSGKGRQRRLRELHLFFYSASRENYNHNQD